MTFKKTGEAEFSTTIQSEKFGTIVVEEKYTDDGAHFVSFDDFGAVTFDPVPFCQTAFELLNFVIWNLMFSN